MLAQENFITDNPSAYDDIDPKLSLFRERVQTWDVIGCMYNRETGRVRFSQNGRNLQPSGHMPKKLLWPAISADAKAEFRINFGVMTTRDHV